MKVHQRELEIELEAETDFERDALKRILIAGQVKILAGATKDAEWPPDPRLTNVILHLPNPDDWGL